jgi:hypothetical protein
VPSPYSSGEAFNATLVMKANTPQEALDIAEKVHSRVYNKVYLSEDGKSWEETQFEVLKLANTLKFL